MYYFAYGADLNKAAMKERCPDSKPLFKAALPHYKLIFADWSRQLHGAKATIIGFSGERVSGAVYEVTAICLNKIDKAETGYRRINVKVYDEDGNQHEAVTYLKTGQPKEDKPSPEYLAGIQKGYREWGLL
jgi:gamma-glutamylcyclotransferase (GGCT)/AIG2-like uncharacterized protein YtfP